MIDISLLNLMALTPQGGIISPLLANIALNGLSQQMGRHLRDIEMFTNKKQKVDLIRYADYFVVIHESRDVIEECYEYIKGGLQREDWRSHQRKPGS